MCRSHKNDFGTSASNIKSLKKQSLQIRCISLYLHHKRTAASGEKTSESKSQIKTDTQIQK